MKSCFVYSLIARFTSQTAIATCEEFSLAAVSLLQSTRSLNKIYDPNA